MFCNIPRMLGMPLLAAALIQLPARGQDASLRLGQLREFSYLATYGTLAELQKLKPQVGQWPQRDQAAYYSILSKVTRSSDRALSLQAVAEEERIGHQLDDETIIANSLLDRSYLYSALEDREAASKSLDMARQLADQTSDFALQAKVILTVGQDEIRRGNGRKGLELIDSAVALADKSGQPIAQFMALRARAYALNGLAGGSQEALRSIDVLKAKAALIPLDGPMIRARYAEWEIAESAGQVARARDALNDVVAWLQKHHMDEDVPELQVTLADMSLKSQDYREALSLSRESKQAALATGNTEMAEISQFNEGIALIYLGQLDLGREAIEAVNIEMMDADALSEYARALEYVGLKELALQVYARARRKALDATSAQTQLQKKEREDEELLRRKDENSKDLRNRSKLRLAWSVAAGLAAAALLALALLYRKLRAANVRLKNSDLRTE
ncbi:MULTISPECIES: hypothetical protein [unclassified Duganella]|uniref:hypothetical protein n=1 Tax=unclassified Duganella TaxID=2636909 RepID=UPI0006F205BA|nr:MULTISPECIES: hypothetical protein [unclassified Duganella]KQV45859.1 hypothetical protein ASD07_15285 [Duganella sp. Root336D2]KRC03735.1 hypothetical protein ASE26_02585 [Duganella sp. Root198D2]